MRPTDYVSRQVTGGFFFLCFVFALWAFLYNVIVGVPVAFVAEAFQDPIWNLVMSIMLAIGILGLLLGILEALWTVTVFKELKKMASSDDWYSMSMTDEISKFEKKLWNFPLIGFFLVKRMMPWLSELRHEAKKKRINEIYEDALKCAKEGQPKLAVEYFAAVIRLLPREKRAEYHSELHVLIVEMISRSYQDIHELNTQIDILESARKSHVDLSTALNMLCWRFEVEGVLDEMPD